MELEFFTQAIQDEPTDAGERWTFGHSWMSETLEANWADIMEKTAGFTSNEALSNYIRGVYLSAVSLSDRATRNCGKLDSDEFRHLGLKQDVLHQILDRSRWFFPKHFDGKDPVTLYMWADILHDLMELREKFLLDEDAGCDKVELRTLIAKVITRIYGKEFPGPTDEEYRYWVAFRDAVWDVLEEVQLEPEDESLKKVLITFSFNAPEIVEYFSGRLAEEAEFAGSSEERKKVWQSAVQYYSSKLNLHRYSLNPECVSLAAILAANASTGLMYNEPDPVDTSTGSKNPEVEFRIQLRVTNTQFGTMLRLMERNGVFVCTNITELLRVIASGLTAINGQAVGPESLRSNFYDSRLATCEAVEEILSQMIRMLRTPQPWELRNEKMKK